MDRSEVVNIGWIQAASRHFQQENLDFFCHEIELLAKDGAEVIFLPELFLWDYFPQEEHPRAFETAIAVDGPEVEKVKKLSRDLGVIVNCPIFEKRAPGIYHNSCLTLEAGEVLDIYRKMHIPDDPGFFEKYYFTPGDLGWKVVQTSKLNIGLLICWDQWFPEAARLTAMSGADCLYYPTAIGWDIKEPEDIYEDQVESWMVMLRSHSVANGCFTLAVNRVGQEEELKFWGHSLLANPSGRVLNDLNQKEERVIQTLELKKIVEQRQAWPFFRDRRVDAYSDLGKIWRS